MKSVYLGRKLLFKQFLLKTREPFIIFILFFKSPCYFSSVRIYLLPKRTNQPTFSDVRKILTDNTIIMYNNNKNLRLQI